MSIHKAVEFANSVLPGVPSSEGLDARWQAIIGVGAYVQTDPADVWRFITRWGAYSDADIQTAIATCLLEHLLEYHFDEFFLKVAELAMEDVFFAKTFTLCYKCGKSNNAANSQRFDQLEEAIKEKWGL